MKNGTVKEDEQGYLVSVSDMMSGLIFLFIIVLMVFVRKNMQETKKLVDTRKQLTDAKEVRKELLEDLKESLHRENVIVHIDTERGLLHVPEGILFQSGKAEFLEDGEKRLSILARILADRLPCYAGKRGSERSPDCSGTVSKPGYLEAVFVEGHTDNVPVRSNAYDNWDLSARRSIVTYKCLMKYQYELDNLQNADGEPLFGVSGYADQRPVIRHSEIKDEPQNRRIDLRFILTSPESREN